MSRWQTARALAVPTLAGPAYIAADFALGHALSRFLIDHLTPIALGAALGIVAAFLTVVYRERTDR